jgi:methylisocitrate lyase
MVIWPVSSLRVANKAQAHLFAALNHDGGTHNIVGEMQTWAELCELIGLKNFEALDASIVETKVPSLS